MRRAVPLLTVLSTLALTTLQLAAAPLVTDVAAPASRDQRQIRLGDPVWIRVSDLAEVHALEAAANAPVTLWIDGRDTGVAAEAINDASGWMRFRLDRTDGNRDLWSDLLHAPFGDPSREITLSVGIHEPLPARPGSNLRLTLLKIIPMHAFLWLALLLALALLFIRLAKTTDIVRNGPPIGTQKQPYSLGRIQMAWWFVLILAGFVAIALISGDEASINPSLLALMGISAATALGSAAIDTSPTTTTGAESENWFLDILKDDAGTIALHRLQIVAWTIVLGVMFIASVCTKLTMPEFSGTLLALMGVSGGTYLGFKIPGVTRNGG